MDSISDRLFHKKANIYERAFKCEEIEWDEKLELPTAYEPPTYWDVTPQVTFLHRQQKLVHQKVLRIDLQLHEP